MTPIEVAEAALANWGDEKAQEAFAEVKAILDGRFSEAARKVSAELLERVRRAEADNAALLKRIDAIGHSLGTYGNDVTTQELIGSILRDPHPGAALLEELEGLRAENERLRQERDHWEGRAALTASEVALEEAARVLAADGAPIVREMQHVIRALKKTGQGE